jgi:Fur family transcriptional regulator, ferric uptake regulator
VRQLANTTPDPVAVLSAFIAKRGLKSTRQRQVILEAFRAADGHLTMDELLARSRKSDPRVSPATVYRTLRLFSECGLARPQQFDGAPTTYELVSGREHHDHLVCTRCGDVVEFEHDRIEALQVSVARAHGFSVGSHRMELYGLCRRCQQAGKPRRRAAERQPHAQTR